MPSRFVQPGSRRLPLSGGDWILVRSRLSAGDQREMLRRFYVTDHATSSEDNSRTMLVSCPHCAAEGREVKMRAERRLDLFESALSQVITYLLDWSLTDDNGEVVAIRDLPIEVVRSTLDALDPDTYTEIKDAVEAHIDAMQKEREEEKKLRTGAVISSATLPSPDAAGGDLRMSAPST